MNPRCLKHIIHQGILVCFAVSVSTEAAQGEIDLEVARRSTDAEIREAAGSESGTGGTNTLRCSLDM